jgi:hypothetical protein
MSPKANSVTLSELVEYAADELRRVKQKKPAAGGPVMQFKECELELTVTVSNEGEGGIKFWIVTAGAKVSKETTSVIRLKFESLAGDPVQAAAQQVGPAPKPQRQ